MEFNFDVDMMLDSVINALESVAADTSLEQFEKIVNAIEGGMPGVVEVLTYGISEHWKQEATKAGPWGSKYAAAIRVKFNNDTGEIYLDQKSIDKTSNKPNIMFAKMMEYGVKVWSIKDALLKSKKAKTSSKGIKYIVVPFPVATPRKKGQGHMQSKFGKREMTKAMYDIVKSGGKLPPGSFLPTGENVTGLTRYTTQQFHEQYGIFRMVTQNSKGWKFPGKAATPVYHKVLQEANRQANELIIVFLQNIVKEFTT